jgi:hypothetical protein
MPTVVWCGECGDPLDEAPDLPFEQREPCVRCGTTTRMIAAEASLKVGGFVSFKLLHRRPRVSGWLAEHFQGREQRKSVGDFVEKFRLIDRENNRYIERIVIQDGTVLRDVDEPLTDHSDHGSAKFKSRKS